VALERLEHDGSARQVRYRSDKSDGPTAGTETVDPLEFLARLTAHIPNKHQVMTRYYGYYANRVRGARRRHDAGPDEPPPVAERVPLPLREARRRWAYSFDAEHGITAMMRTTGYSLAITGRLQAEGVIEAGVRTPHEAMPGERYLAELAKRGVVVRERA
jgi:hypothetical protein